MKKILSIAIVSCISYFSFAQEKNESATKENKIETIKIINGDTVIHDIRIVEGDFEHHPRHERRERHEMHKRDVQRWVSDEDLNLDSILESLDVYMELKDGHKKMMIKRLSMNDEDVEEILEELEIDEDIIIEMEDGKKSMKVMKIQIDDEDVEEIITVDMHDAKNKRFNGPDNKSNNHGLHVFPNPAKDELNIDFEVKEGSPAEVKVIGMNGEVLFSKTYNEPGRIKETIPANAENKGVYIVKLNQEGRAMTKKIILK